jgi:hypothetical protein
MNVVIITAFELSDMMSERSVCIPTLFLSDSFSLFFN